MLASLQVLVGGIAYFAADDMHFLAIAKYEDEDGNPDVTSWVHVWNHNGYQTLPDGARATGTGFEPLQLLPTCGALDFAVASAPCAAVHPSRAASACGRSALTHLLTVVHTRPLGANGRGADIWRLRLRAPALGGGGGSTWLAAGAIGRLERLQTIAASGPLLAAAVSFSIPEGGTFVAFSQREAAGPAASEEARYAGAVTVWKFRGVGADAVECTSSPELCAMVQVQAISGAPLGASVPQANSYVNSPGCRSTGAGCGLSSLVGPTSVHVFESGGDHYMAVAQSFCGIFESVAACEARIGNPVRQPRSSIFQWDSYTQQFTELHSITRQSNLKLRGEPVPANEVLVHQFAFRIPVGRANSVEAFQVKQLTLSCSF